MSRALFLGIALSCLSAACSYDNGDAHHIDDAEPSACPDSPAMPVQTWIDTDAKIEIHAGQAAGVFVEYAAGGHWRLVTTCDSLNSPVPCAWDVILTPEDGRSISNVAAESLEDTDSVAPYPDYPRSYNLLAQTSEDLDGMTFDTEPGTAIAVDAFLDGACALPYFFWVGDGAAHIGAPSNPLVLIPTSD